MNQPSASIHDQEAIQPADSIQAHIVNPKTPSLTTQEHRAPGA